MNYKRLFIIPLFAAACSSPGAIEKTFDPVLNADKYTDTRAATLERTSGVERIFYDIGSDKTVDIVCYGRIVCIGLDNGDREDPRLSEDYWPLPRTNSNAARMEQNFAEVLAAYSH